MTKRFALRLAATALAASALVGTATGGAQAADIPGNSDSGLAHTTARGVSWE